MIEGLKFYEFVLMLCGIVLFFALIVVLFVYLARKKPLTGVFASFLLPVVMMGFSGIQKIDYDNGKVTIEKYATSPPTNPAERQALDAALEKVESRTPATSQSHELLARGYAASSKPKQAFAQATKAADLGADSQRIAPLIEKAGIEVITQTLPTDAEKVSDPTNKAELEKVINRLKAQTKLSTDGKLNLSRALVAVGRKDEAVATLGAAAKQAPQIKTSPAYLRMMRGAVVPPQ